MTDQQTVYVVNGCFQGYPDEAPDEFGGVFATELGASSFCDAKNQEEEAKRQIKHKKCLECYPHMVKYYAKPGNDPPGPDYVWSYKAVVLQP
jgi:hypothetical protein